MIIHEITKFWTKFLNFTIKVAVVLKIKPIEAILQTKSL